MPFLRKLPRRLVTLLLALALFAPASSFGRVLYACGMTGKVTSGGCCCRHAKLKAARQERAARLAPSPKLERPACCSAEDHRRAAVPSSLADETSARVLTPSLVATLPAEAEPALVSEQVSLRARAIRGPPRGAHVFAANCALLI